MNRIHLNMKGLLVKGTAMVALTTLAVACSDEDTPAVSYENPATFFQPADTDTTATARLRRDFFQKTGSYLLFNDTLQHRFLGYDAGGDAQYFNETVDLTYNVGQSSHASNTYVYTYITSPKEQQTVVQFLNDYILNHMTNRMRPYSFFLARLITGYDSNTGKVTLCPYSMSNQRCTAIACNYLLLRDRSDAQKQNFAQTVLYAMVGQMAQNNISSFNTFFSYSSQYYNAVYSEAGVGTVNNDVMRRLGFLGSSTGSALFPSRETDLNAYVVQTLQYSESQIATLYAGNEVVLNKFAEVRRVLIELGYKF